MLIYLGVVPVPTPSRKEKSDWDGGGRTGAPIGSRFVITGFWFLRSCIAALRSSISSTLISISKIINYIIPLTILHQSYLLKDDEAFWINLRIKIKKSTKEKQVRKHFKKFKKIIFYLTKTYTIVFLSQLDLL
jgi:hypothetical protein